MSTGWALAVAVTEEFLNRLAAEGIGDGIATEPLRRRFAVPMMGEVDLEVGMTITGVTFVMAEEHGSRLLATVHAAGVVRIHGESAMPAFPGAARVSGDVLVSPVVHLEEDGAFTSVLDLAGSELVAMRFEGIDGLDTDADAAAMMGEMLFATVGGELFEGLAEQLGRVGLELEAGDGDFLLEAGVAPGSAEVRVHDGSLLVGLPAAEGTDGHADVPAFGGGHLVVGLASGVLSPLVIEIAHRATGLPVPFDVEVDTRERRIGGRVRSPRLFDLPLVPDLRPGVRYTVRPRLVDGRIEVALREAWLELPLVPGFVNEVNRIIGGMASRSPWSFSTPARRAVPVRPDSEREVDMEVTDLFVDPHGVTLVVDAHWHDDP